MDMTQSRGLWMRIVTANSPRPMARPFCLLVAIVMLSASGCITARGYVPAKPYPPRAESAFDVYNPQIERGRPAWLVDKLGHYLFSLPRKLILWNWRIGDHQISPKQKKLVREFLEINRMRHTKVRINQYAPFGEFKRLWKNSDVSPLYRASVGLFHWLWYTFVPGRLLAGSSLTGDHYSAYTDTIHLYSGDQSIIIRTAGYAKDSAQRKFKGTHAVLGLIPGVDLYLESVAVDDAFQYFFSYGSRRDTAKAYHVLHPNYGSSFGRSIAPLIGPVIPPVQAVATIVLVIPGHIAGRIQAR